MQLTPDEIRAIDIGLQIYFGLVVLSIIVILIKVIIEAID